MKQDLGPLGQIDMLTSKELSDTMGHHFDHAIRDWYRGLDFLQFAGGGNGTNTLTLPGGDQGYTWSYKLVSCQLAAAGVLSIYPSDNTNVACIGTTTALANNANFDAVMTWSGNQVVLKDGRNLTLYSSQIILNWRIMVLAVPTEMQGKLNALQGPGCAQGCGSGRPDRDQSR
jgi:hypothetical protein